MATFVQLALASGGGVIEVNPDAVDAVEDVPSSSPPASYVSFTGEGTPTRITVLGTSAVVAAALSGGGGGGTSGQYTPALASAPVPPILNVFFSSDWTYTRAGNVVCVWGRFDVQFQFGSIGFIECLTPPGTPLPVPFSTVGGGASTCRRPVSPGTQEQVGAVFKGAGATSALRFELYDPLGHTVIQPGTVEFAISYVVP
jgi:hypothetical protein